MSYIINLTNGTRLTEIKDGSVNQTATDITLIGRNATNYGTFFNDDLVHILENFANNSQPSNPLIGQLWYDTSDNVLRVYNGSSFTPTGNTVVAKTKPVDLATGGLWINSDTGQIFFNDGSSTVLAGPIYTTSQGKTGFESRDVVDTNNINQTVVLLFVSNILLGVFSKTAFTPRESIDANYTGGINIGFNVSSYAGVAFDVLASKASALLSPDGNDVLSSDEFVRAFSDTALMTGSLSIQNTSPLFLGTNSEFEISVVPSLVNLAANRIDQNFQISVAGTTALVADSAHSRIGIFTNSPATTLDVNGDTTVRGTLSVLGKSNAPVAISLTTTGLNNLDIAANYLIKIFPNTEHADSTVCRAVCTDAGTTTIKQYTLVAGVWTWQSDIA